MYLYITCMYLYITYIYIYISHVCIYISHACIYISHVCIYISHIYIYISHVCIYISHVRIYISHVRIYISHYYMHVFIHRSAQVGCDISTIFKQSLTGLNTELSSSRPVVNPRAKSPVCLAFCNRWKENNWIHIFSMDNRAMWNAIGLVQDRNSCRRINFPRR